MDKKIVSSKFSMDVWAALIIMALGIVFACVCAVYATYLYLFEFVMDLSYPSDDVANLIATISQMIIPILLIGASLLLFTRTRTDHKASNNIRLVLLGGTAMITVASLINVFVFNYYIRDHSWVENIEVMNHLSFLGTIFLHLGFVVFGVAAILLVRSFLEGRIYAVHVR
jgi:hypothetical protein